MTNARIAAGQQHADTLTALSKTDTNIAVLKEQSTTMHDQLDEMREKRRAWVGPVSVGFANGLPQIGKPSTVFVKYHNTGRGPPIHVSSDFSPSVITIAEDIQGVGRTHIADYVDHCRAARPVVGDQVVFLTTGFSGYTTGRVIEGNSIDLDILYGTKISSLLVVTLTTRWGLLTLRGLFLVSRWVEAVEKRVCGGRRAALRSQVAARSPT